MREFTIRTNVQAYKENELPEEYKRLVDEAKRQTEHSYSPYSHFAVGAAAELSDGTIVGGSNQENAAYPSGLCAERTTLFYAHSAYPNLAVKTLAIACCNKGHFTELPGSPCGACRQVMTEFEDEKKTPMRVILYGAKETYVFERASDLMPLVFVQDSLLKS